MKLILPILVASLALASLPGEARAQSGPDIRNIRPHVMLLVDTSGSMERIPDCICSTPACLECLPVCAPGNYQQNRWSIVAQALTGEFTPFECASEVRIGGDYSGAYDEGYFLPHILLPQEIDPATASQSGNGVLDTYIERIKFGLMTFDAIGTLSSEPPLVSESTFTTTAFLDESVIEPGMFSYGENRPFSFPAALTTYMINSGARSQSADVGGLVSVGGDSTSDMTSTNENIQRTILGDSGAGKDPIRPFGATPTDALIEDLQFFLNDDTIGDITRKTSAAGPGDAFYACRPRSAVLITDGFPNGVMRGDPVNCQDLSQPTGPNGCPYDLSADIVTDMIASGELDNFYVIGFALDVTNTDEREDVETLLNDLASVGDTDEAFFVSNRDELVSALSQILNEQNPGATSRTAPVQTGLTPGLVQSEFISGFNVSADADDPWDGILERRRVECEGGVPVAQEVEARDRFQEVLNSQGSAPGSVEPFSSGDRINFGGGFSRNLWTITPDDATDINGYLVGNGKDKLTALGDGGIDVPPDTGLDVRRNVRGREFSSTLDPEYFFGVGSTDSAGVAEVVDWIHGVPGTDREDERLGDIYHSTPAIVGPLVDDLEDRSYNDWRLGLESAHQQSPDPSETDPRWQLNERPRVIYAATNDGIIHAFLADDYANGAFSPGNNLDEFACADGQNAGTELWGFIPPMFLDDLDDLLVGGSKQWYADGSIIVRNLYDVRAFSQTDGGGGAEDSPAGETNVWRTVLFLSFRNGGQGMVALDVTNPCKPEFLWQFTDPNLGDTYGQPTAAQIFIEDNDPTPLGNSGGPVVFKPRQSRAVILLPGGEGVEEGTTCSYTLPGPELPQGMTTATGSTISPRTDRRCWRGTTTSPSVERHGRSLYFIDMITGTILREIGEDRFPAPLNGAVSVFRGDTGTVGSVAYTVDADGILWRIDMSSSDPEDWDAVALHDLYYDEGFDDAEPTYFPPALTINSAGEIVVLVGTGNIDVLDDSTAVNQVVSITEQLTFGNDGFIDVVEGRLNWEIELFPGEQMTGPLELFGGQVFFGTFESGTGTAVNACPLGTSRIFGVSFLDDPTNDGDLVGLLNDGSPNPVPFLDSSNIPELNNSLLVGLQVAQQPVCTLTQDIDLVDPFTGAARTLAMPYATSGREFKLMAHLSGSSALSSGLSIAILEEGIGAPEGFTVVSAMAETLE